jgi:hypothetical protein
VDLKEPGYGLVLQPFQRDRVGSRGRPLQFLLHVSRKVGRFQEPLVGVLRAS